MKKFLLTCIVSIVGIVVLFAQPPQMQGSGQGQPRQGMGNMPSDGKITGKILDAATSQSVEYASVAIYREMDSTLVTGVVTDASGNFTLEKLPYGKFYATITFIGYKKNNVGGIMLNPSQKTANLGSVKLDPSSTTLNEVVVLGNGNQMEYKIDKKVVNISQNIVASGGTVVDALQNTPSVQTDLEGNLSLRGSSNFTVLIDGKPSVVSGSEALQQIPAGLVQNVEIITNPSAKYDAEGSAGIINVIMKKQKIKGFNGNISLSAGTNRKNNDNLTFNYKYNKWNFTIGADYRDMGFQMNNTTQRKIYSQGVLLKDQLVIGSGKFSRGGIGLRGGIDYNINDNSSITIGGRWGTRQFERPSSALYRDSFPGFDNFYYRSINSGKTDDNFYSVNLDYLINFDKNGHQLLASVYYSGSDENDPSNTLQDTTDRFWNALPDSSSTQEVRETGKEYEYRFKADYTLPINDKTTLEAGFQTEFEDNTATHRLFKNKIEDMSQLDDLSFKQNINSAYATFSSSTKLFDYQLGLRMENENRDVKQLDLNKTTSISRIDPFPTIHLSRKLPWEMQVQASYTRRISRPRNWSLSPLRRYMDPQNVQVGNPALLPEFTNAYELNLQKQLNELSFVSIEGFYRKTDNPMQQFIDTTELNQGITINTVKNLGKSESIGGELMINLGITKWWTLNGSGSLYNYKLTGESALGVTTRSSTNWNLRANSMFRIKTGTSIQLNYFYNAPTVTAQGSRGGTYSTGIAVRQDLFDKKASLTLNLRDFIGNPEMKSITDTPAIYSYNLSKRETRVFTVTFTYRINNYKSSSKRNQDDMNMERGDDMGNEMM